MQVASNYGRLDPERGSRLGATHTEDMLSIGKSDYTLIEDNYLIGGDSPSGCGIIVEGPSSFTTIRDNVVIRTAQCGIGVANADHTLVEDNRVLDTNLIDLGLTIGGNIGIYVWRSSDSSDNCFSNTVQRNIVSNRRPNGKYNDLKLSSRSTSTVKRDNITGSAARSLLHQRATSCRPRRSRSIGLERRAAERPRGRRARPFRVGAPDVARRPRTRGRSRHGAS